MSPKAVNQRLMHPTISASYRYHALAPKLCFDDSCFFFSYSLRLDSRRISEASQGLYFLFIHLDGLL